WSEKGEAERVDHADAATASVEGIDALERRLVEDCVGVDADVDRLRDLEVVKPEDADRVRPTVAGEAPIQSLSEGNAVHPFRYRRSRRPPSCPVRSTPAH